MWVVESETVDPSVKDIVDTYRLAKIGISPEAADQMSNEKVEGILFLDNELIKKEREISKGV